MDLIYRASPIRTSAPRSSSTCWCARRWPSAGRSTSPRRSAACSSTPGSSSPPGSAGRLVGVSRAITDFSYCTYLSDLAVDRDYQRQGIGRELIRLTHEAAGLDTMLILLAAPLARTYYPHIGMNPHDSCWIIPRTALNSAGHGAGRAVVMTGEHDPESYWANDEPALDLAATADQRRGAYAHSL